MRFIDLDEVVGFCELAKEAEPEILLIEAAGGVMAPINDDAVMLDWAKALGCPTLAGGWVLSRYD